jgi:hypothetical protein
MMGEVCGVVPTPPPPPPPPTTYTPSTAKPKEPFDGCNYTNGYYDIICQVIQEEHF